MQAGEEQQLVLQSREKAGRARLIRGAPAGLLGSWDRDGHLDRVDNGHTGADTDLGLMQLLAAGKLPFE